MTPSIWIDYEKRLEKIIEQKFVIKRKNFADLKKYLTNQETKFKVLSGLRRIGKTTTLYQLINFLHNEKKVKLAKIFYYSLDKLSVNGIKSEEFKREVQIAIETDKIEYIFLDEIQDLIAWKKWLKILYDDVCVIYRKNIKIIATGSNCLEINDNEDGIGRFDMQNIFPWSYEEYQQLLMSKKISNKNSFDEYLTFGQFPEFVQPTIKNFEKFDGLKTYILNETLKDIKNILKTKISMEEITRIIYYLVETTNNEINKDKMAQQLSLNIRTLNKFLDAFVASKLLFEIEQVNALLVTKSKRNKKYFLASPNFICALLHQTFAEIKMNSETNQFVGSITETIFLQKIIFTNQNNLSVSYVKNKQNLEIDFFLKIIGQKHDNKILYEIKYREVINKNMINDFFWNYDKSYIQKILIIQNALPLKHSLTQALNKKNIEIVLLKNFVQNW